MRHGDLELRLGDGLARLTLNRPPLNLLTPSLFGELRAALRAVREDPSIRVVILGGAGEAFSAGVDVHAMKDLDAVSARAFVEDLHQTILAVRELDRPVIARLHGYVLGGSLELAMGCDLRVAAATTRLGMPEIKVGIPSVIEAALLPGLVGWGRAAELLLTGEMIDGVEAERIGLVNRAVAPERLEAETEALAARLLALSPTALRLQKTLLTRWRQVDLASAVRLGIEAFGFAYTTDEPRKAMEAFLQRRRPPAS